jgi:hypothetical protein
MKTLMEKSQSGWALAAVLLALACLTTLGWAQDPPAPAIEGAAPRIASVVLEGAELVITVEAPKGVRKVTLESRTRLGVGTWVPRLVKRLDGQAQTILWRLPFSEKLEVLRVRADQEDTLPGSFFAGQTRFDGAQAASPDLRGNYDVGAPTAGNGDGGEATRQVEESDIWKLDGNTLFFFNQYRGLQMIDITLPDQPVVKAVYPLPAVGEDMYKLGANHVLLLARSDCYDGSSGSRVLVVPVNEFPLEAAAEISLSGYVRESRLVGSALYVASETYRRVSLPPKPDGADGETWEWGVEIVSIDLADPAHPLVRNREWYAGYGNVVQATDQYFFVGVLDTASWNQSVVHILDIATPDGSMARLSSIRAPGRVSDKFKLYLHQNVFSLISQAAINGRTASVLETYDLSVPSAPRKLGEVHVGHGEALFATRFDGTRAYIVTFLRIDPLWVVDLADPTHPTVVGELQVPGWSTYIHPLGDRLVTVGVDNSNSWRVAVSLFDVADPTKPALLSKVALGEGYSWSEANDNEKALSVLPDAGLIMVPYQGWETNGYASRIQLIDLGQTTLTARGVIEHRMQPRRSTVVGDRILSISGRELLTVNAADRDHPVVTAQTELAWPVNRVLAVGEYLVEMENGPDWSGSGAATLRVVAKANPERVLANYRFENGLSLLGASLQGSRLYTLQGESASYYPWYVAANSAADAQTNATPTNRVVLSAFELAAFPEVRLAGQTEVFVAQRLSGSMRPAWPASNVVVWASAGGYPWRWYALDAVGGAAAADAAVGLWWPWWNGSGSPRLLAFGVAEATPQLLADTELGLTNAWDLSDPHTAGGRVYLSHRSSEFVEGLLVGGQTKPAPEVVQNPDGTWKTNQPVYGAWVSRYYLDVVDYADPSNPTVRRPVNIPGALKELAHEGAVLFTQGVWWQADGTTDWTEYVHACAYDGVEAALVAKLSLPGNWPRPVAFGQGTVYLGRTATNASSGTLEAWRLSDQGEFALAGARQYDTPVQDLMAAADGLALRRVGGLELLDLNQPFDAPPIAAGSPPGCLWLDLSAGVIDGSRLWLPLQDYGVWGLESVRQP